MSKTRLMTGKKLAGKRRVALEVKMEGQYPIDQRLEATWVEVQQGMLFGSQ
jgi:hypothetical protein